MGWRSSSRGLVDLGCGLCRWRFPLCHVVVAASLRSGSHCEFLIVDVEREETEGFPLSSDSGDG
jgi:hypothetical protein